MEQPVISNPMQQMLHMSSAEFKSTRCVLEFINSIFFGKSQNLNIRPTKLFLVAKFDWFSLFSLKFSLLSLTVLSSLSFSLITFDEVLCERVTTGIVRRLVW